MICNGMSLVSGPHSVVEWRVHSYCMEGLMSERFFSGVAVAAPEIFIPSNRCDLSRWPVIACDQYTSDPAYWEETERIVGDAPSSLRIILPEVTLETQSADELTSRIHAINENLLSYSTDGTLEALPAGFILLNRSTSLHPSRHGLVLAVDLEEYDFSPGSQSRIRATEGTVLSRIPPRVRIRERAILEMPHIMLLIDDPDQLVIRPAYESLAAASDCQPVYDIDLMQGGGHLTGYYTPANSAVAEGIVEALQVLANRSRDGLLFAVGDGNHSLATAKTIWNSIRSTLSEEEFGTHPSRFALVEVVNIHDDGLAFEPIHRVASGISAEDFCEFAARFFANEGVILRDGVEDAPDAGLPTQSIPFFDKNKAYILQLTHPAHPLAVGSLQNCLDALVSGNDAIHIDYIHGEADVSSLVDRGYTGFLLPSIEKASFFDTIRTEGVFPRKTFSMGESFEKRYYLEARRILPEVVV